MRRWWASIAGWVSRIWIQPRQILFGSGDPVQAEYPVDNSMSVLARFPWLWTAVQAISSDMAGTPLVAVRPRARVDLIDEDDGEQVVVRTEDRAAQRRAWFRRVRVARRLELVGAVHRGVRAATREIVDDPAVALLGAPNAGSSGWLLAKQLWVDFLLTGNWYLWAPEGGASVAVYRLHPKQVQPLAGAMGVAVAYRITDPVGGGQIELPPEQVIHCRDVSWQDSLSALLGESPIRCLHDDLTADLGARETSARISAKGRPDILFSVKGGLGDGLIGSLLARWEAAIKARHGAFIVGDDTTATPLGWSPSDLADQERSDRLRDTTLAVMGVPPTRAGLTSASYSGARQEARAYWEGLRGRGRAFEDAISRLARPGVRLEYDYSAVESLQVSYTERLMRVSTWVGLGASPKEAAAYEGFDEAPVPDAPIPAADFTPAVPIDRPAEEPQADRQSALRTALRAHVQSASAAYDELDGGLVGGADRRLFVRWQTERLFADLSRVVDTARARWWAEELAGVVDELRRADAPLDECLADRLADRVHTSLRSAA